MELQSKPLFDNRRLVQLLIPLVLESFLNILVGLVDGIMVSPVGEAAISGVAMVDNISNVLINVFSALATGGAIIVSQAIGSQQREMANRSTGQLVLMTCAVGLVISIPCLLFARQVLNLLFGRVEADVMANAMTYFYYSALSYPFVALYNAAAAIFRSNGNSKTTFYCSLLKNGINIAGNAICIYGLKMGVSGVAIPTLLSRMISACLIMYLATRPRLAVRPAVKDIFSIQSGIQKRILKTAVPTALQNSTLQFGRLLTLSMISGFGTLEMAANTTANLLTNFSVVIPTSFRIASFTVIGQCVGAHDEKQIKENVRRIMTWCYISNGILCVAMSLLRYPLLGVYDSLSPETVELASKLMLIHLLAAIVLYPMAYVLDGPLRAANCNAYTMWVNMLTMLVLRLGLAYILCVVLGWGAVGVWVAMVCGWVVHAVCFVPYYLCGAWKKKCGLG